MVHGAFRTARMTAILAAAVAMLAWSAPAVTAPVGEEDVPATSIVPAAGESAPAPVNPPSSAGTPSAPTAAGMPYLPAPAPKPSSHRASTKSKNSVREPEVEPADARLKLLQSVPVYSAPAKSSKHIAQVSQDNFVIVTGATHYYLQVKLKNGQTGYIDPSAVELVKPTDKVFVLTHDAGVLEKPNRWAKKLAEVHQGRNIHIVGLSLNYMKIRMKSGLEGFIPITALE
jgi:hypothetical protein